MSTQEFLDGFGTPLTARDYGEHVASALTDHRYESAQALVIRGDSGVQPLDA